MFSYILLHQYQSIHVQDLRCIVLNIIFQSVEGILPKGPYLPCVSMSGRALLAGHHRCVLYYYWPDISSCQDIRRHGIDINMVITFKLSLMFLSGLSLENYIQEELNDTRLLVLKGEVMVEIVSSGKNTTLTEGQEIRVRISLLIYNKKLAWEIQSTFWMCSWSKDWNYAMSTITLWT